MKISVSVVCTHNAGRVTTWCVCIPISPGRWLWRVSGGCREVTPGICRTSKPIEGADGQGRGSGTECVGPALDLVIWVLGGPCWGSNPLWPQRDNPFSILASNSSSLGTSLFPQLENFINPLVVRAPCVIKAIDHFLSQALVPAFSHSAFPSLWRLFSLGSNKLKVDRSSERVVLCRVRVCRWCHSCCVSW